MFTEIVAVSLPQALVTITEYKPAALTEIDGLVAPVLHANCEAPDAVSTRESFMQKVVGPPEVITAVGMFPVVETVTDVTVVQPFVSVIVQVYVPAGILSAVELFPPEGDHE